MIQFFKAKKIPIILCFKISKRMPCSLFGKKEPRTYKFSSFITHFYSDALGKTETGTEFYRTAGQKRNRLFLPDRIGPISEQYTKW